MEYMAVFFTHSGAMKYDKHLKSMNINCQLMPVPRKLSSNCGIGVKFSCSSDINEMISEDIEKLFALENREHKLVYAAE